MNDEVKQRRVRGKGKVPAKVHVNIRIASDAMDFYRSFPNCSAKMREVLTEYAHQHMPKAEPVAS